MKLQSDGHIKSIFMDELVALINDNPEKVGIQVAHHELLVSALAVRW